MKYMYLVFIFGFGIGCNDCIDSKNELSDMDGYSDTSDECIRDDDACTRPNGTSGICTTTRCDSEPVCVPVDQNQCSAVAPFPACSCGGVIVGVSAGCPGPFGWASGFLSPPDWMNKSYECNPNDEPPFTFDVTWKFTPVGASDEHAFFYPTNADRISISGSEGEVEVRETLSPNDTLRFHILIDVNKDGLCDANDRVYRGFSNGNESKIDFKNYTLELSDDSPTELTMVPCESF